MRDDQIGTDIKANSQNPEYISSNSIGAQKKHQKEAFSGQIPQQLGFLPQNKFLSLIWDSRRAPAEPMLSQSFVSAVDPIKEKSAIRSNN